MGNRRKKIQKTSKKNQETKVAWADLPQGILELILGKLVDSVDLIRFRVVCKNWHNIDMPNDRILNLPWLCNLTWAKDHSNRLECQIYDPYSSQVFTTSKLVHGCRYTRFYSNHIEFLCSKQGWLIGHYKHYYMPKWEIFMYNPYSQEFIPLRFTEWRPCCATFSGNPVASQNCRVFVFCRGKVFLSDPYKNHIYSYGLNGDMKEWKLEFVETNQQECCGIQYMNEQLFCLFKDGIMRRYSLADGSCTQIVLGEGSHRLVGYNQPLCLPQQPLWLGKGDGDLLVACELGLELEYSAFYFDWSNMSWVGSDHLQESSAIFISGKVATFVRPFEEINDDREDNKDWKFYFFHDLDHPSYYGHTKMRLEYKSSTVFIEPPPIN